MSIIIRTILTLVILGITAASGHAAPETSVAIAPVTSLAKTSAKKLAAIETVIKAGLNAVSNTKVIGAKEAANRARKAKRPELRTCDGDLRCIAALGTLLGTEYVVYAELGGLGATEVLYLKLVSVGTGKELRSTTLNLSSGQKQILDSKAAATRLLAPNQYVGMLAIQSSIDGAIIFLDGHKIATTPARPLPVFVGSHALRITHPEARDFVRFVDIEFGKQSSIDAKLSLLPGVNQDLTREGLLGSPTSNKQILVKRNSTPWYFRWYTITGGVTAIAITSALLFRSDGIDSDLVIDL